MRPGYFPLWLHNTAQWLVHQWPLISQVNYISLLGVPPLHHAASLGFSTSLNPIIAISAARVAGKGTTFGWQYLFRQLCNLAGCDLIGQCNIISWQKCIHWTTLKCNIMPNISSILLWCFAEQERKLHCSMLLHLLRRGLRKCPHLTVTRSLVVWNINAYSPPPSTIDCILVFVNPLMPKHCKSSFFFFCSCKSLHFMQLYTLFFAGVVCVLPVTT